VRVLPKQIAYFGAGEITDGSGSIDPPDHLHESSEYGALCVCHGAPCGVIQEGRVGTEEHGLAGIKYSALQYASGDWIRICIFVLLSVSRTCGEASLYDAEKVLGSRAAVAAYDQTMIGKDEYAGAWIGGYRRFDGMRERESGGDAGDPAPVQTVKPFRNAALAVVAHRPRERID